jgi:hypothetical protein
MGLIYGSLKHPIPLFDANDTPKNRLKIKELEYYRSVFSVA